MTLEEYIEAQVRYLASPESDLPRPVAAFGVTPARATTLLRIG